jgi:E3 ubiquitin-protein ligase RNF14
MEAIFNNSQCINELQPALYNSLDEDVMSEISMLSSIYHEEMKEQDPSILQSIIAAIPSKAKEIKDSIPKIFRFDIFHKLDSSYKLNVVSQSKELSSAKNLDYLPPISICVYFHTSYPKAAPPLYSIRSNWLDDKAIKTICSSLDSMFNSGQLVVFEWLNYLQNNAIDSIPWISNKIINVPFDKNYRHKIEYLVSFNQDKFEIDFYHSDHICTICDGKYCGTKMSYIQGCSHFFCKNCLAEYIGSLIINGEIDKIVCPFESCKVNITDTDIKKLVSEEVFNKYESFSVMKAIQNSKDFSWCPLCEGPAAKKANTNIATCLKCNFEFCLSCRKKYHPYRKCDMDDDTQSTNKYLTDNKEKLTKILLNEKEEGKYNEMKSQAFMNKYTKQCPNCTASINKFDGCNKVVCASCHKAFCWLCLVCIHSYEHFEFGTCPLFREEELLSNKAMSDITIEDVVDVQSMMIKSKERLYKCPKCAMLDASMDKYNLITCKFCSCKFCFQCNLITDEKHFDLCACLKYSNFKTL